MISVDLKDAKRLARELEQLNKRAIPFAIRNSLNRSAFAARKVWQGEIQKEFVLRNKFTTRSIRVDQARGLNPNRMAAVVGSVAPYMKTQEFGGTERGGGKHGMPIRTGVAAGQRGAHPPTRTVRRKNYLSAIKLKRGAKVGSRSRRNAIAISRAMRAGTRFVFLELERKKGLFRIAGGKRRPRFEMVHDLSFRSVRIPKAPTLQRTLKRIEPKLVAIHVGALRQQLKRHRLLGH